MCLRLAYSCQPHFRLPPRQLTAKLAASLRRNRLPKLATPSAASLPGTTPALLLTPPPPHQLHLHHTNTTRNKLASTRQVNSVLHHRKPHTPLPAALCDVSFSAPALPLPSSISGSVPLLALLACHCWSDHHPRFELLLTAGNQPRECSELQSSARKSISASQLKTTPVTTSVGPHLCLISRH